MTAATSSLVAFLRDTRLEDIPAPVVQQAKRTLLNYFGCALGGANHASVQSVLKTCIPWSGVASSSVIGRAVKVTPPLAALLNGMSSAVYSFDDTHAEALVHPGGPVASAVLGLAEWKRSSGNDVLLAFLLGAETVCRISKAVSVKPAQARTEWVQTGICGGIGAAAAVGRLLNLSAEEMTSAIGIAACRAAGFRGLTRSSCFSYMAGSAAESGLIAAEFAEQGMTGPKEPLSSDFGFLAAFSSKPNPSAITDGLGRTYELLANTYKPYPCGVVIHPAIDASLSVVARISDIRDIERVEAHVNPAVAKLADIPNPGDQYAAQMSLQHWVCSALAFREAGIEQSKDLALQDSRIALLRERTTIVTDETLARTAARVRLCLRSGLTVSADVSDCRGSAAKPMSDSEIETKFAAQAHGILDGDAIAQLAHHCWSIEHVADIATVMRIARG